MENHGYFLNNIPFSTGIVIFIVLAMLFFHRQITAAGNAIGHIRHCWGGTDDGHRWRRRYRSWIAGLRAFLFLLLLTYAAGTGRWWKGGRGGRNCRQLYSSCFTFCNYWRKNYANNFIYWFKFLSKKNNKNLSKTHISYWELNPI